MTKTSKYNITELVCTEKTAIEEIKEKANDVYTTLHGENGNSDGVLTKIALIQSKLTFVGNLWIWISGFSIVILTAVGSIFVTTFKVNTMWNDRVSQRYFLEVMETQSKINDMFDKVDTKNEDSIKEIRQKLEEYDDKFTPMRATRSYPPTTPKK